MSTKTVKKEFIIPRLPVNIVSLFRTTNIINKTPSQSNTIIPISLTNKKNIIIKNNKSSINNNIILTTSKNNINKNIKQLSTTLNNNKISNKKIKVKNEKYKIELFICILDPPYIIMFQ